MPTKFTLKYALDMNGTRRLQKTTSVNITAPALACQKNKILQVKMIINEDSLLEFSINHLKSERQCWKTILWRYEYAKAVKKKLQHQEFPLCSIVY